MSQTPTNLPVPKFAPNRKRNSSVANSVKFNHARSSSISSIDEEFFQPPATLMNRERGSFESLTSNRAPILDDIDGQASTPTQALSQQSRNSSFFFKNLNNSSSTLLPLTRTVSFNSIQGGLTTPTSATSPDGKISAHNDSGQVATKSNRLSRLFTSRSSKPGTTEPKTSTRGSFSPGSNKSQVSLGSAASTGSSNIAKPNLIHRQISMSRSIKDKRNVKKPAELSIQTTNLNPTIAERASPLGRHNGSINEFETLSGLPNLTEALSTTTSMTSPQLASNSSLNNTSKSHKHHHHLHINHHNLLRPRNKDNPLSSSSSNSKLISDKGETLYSFSMNGGNFSTSDLQRIFQQLESLNYKDLDVFVEKDVLGDECFALLSFLTLPIFRGDLLKVPLEDLNRLVQLFLYLRLQDINSITTPTKTPTGSSWSSHHNISIFEEIQMLFEQGFKKFNEAYIVNLKNLSAESKVVKAWKVFKTEILFYVEGIFLPLQLELQGIGSLIKQDNYIHTWRELVPKDLSEVYIKRLLLMGFRDTVVIPIYEDDEEENWIHDDVHTEHENSGGDDENENEASVLQCFNMLKSIQSGDSSQNLIDRLLKDILDSSGHAI